MLQIINAINMVAVQCYQQVEFYDNLCFVWYAIRRDIR